MLYKNEQQYFFEANPIYLYSKTDYLILEHYEDLIDNNSYNYYFNIKKVLPFLIKTVCKINSKNHKDIIFNIFIYDNVTIILLDIQCTNIISIAVLSKRTNIKLIKFFLLKITLSFLNYIYNNHCSSTFSLYTKMYENFLLSPITKHFTLNIKQLFRKFDLYINSIIYNNYYLVDLSSDNIIFSGQSLHNLNMREEIKIPDKTIWKEVLYHSHQLKNDYILKNGNLLKILNLEDFYVKIECRSTFPRITFVIKFLPLLEGMVLVHQYKQSRLSRYDGELNKGYRELDISYGYYYGNEIIFRDDNEYECLLNEHELLVDINYYFIECLLCNLTTMGFFISDQIEKIYFSQEVLTTINRCINKYILSKRFKLIDDLTYEDYMNINKIIINELYEDYIQSNNAEIPVRETKFDKKKPEDFLEKLYLSNFPESIQMSQLLCLEILFKSEEINKFINKEDISMNLSLNDSNDAPLYDFIKYKKNKKLTPGERFGYHYLNGTKENRELVDLVDDNFSFYGNADIIKNRFYGVCYPMLYKKSLMRPGYENRIYYDNNVNTNSEIYINKINLKENKNKELFDTTLSDISSGMKCNVSNKNKVYNVGNKRLNSCGEEFKDNNYCKLYSINNNTPGNYKNMKK